MPCCRPHGAAALLTALLMLPGAASAGSAPYFLRNQSPILQVFGLPAPEGGFLTRTGAWNSSVAFTIANHADSGENAVESVVLDGETYYVDSVFRYGLAERWELGLDLPYVAHRSGHLDNLIEGWHDAFSLDNSERQGPSNHLQLAYQRNGLPLVDLRDGDGGIGDVRLSAAYRLFAADDTARSMAVRAVVKLPTGNASKLRGSGATDLALSVEASDDATFAARSLSLSGQLGAVLLGDGELLADQQRRTVPFASVAVAWRWTSAVDLRAQLGVQGKYFDSGLDEIGGTTATFAIGGVVRLHRLGVELDVALIEDLISDATPDFGVHLSVRRTLRSSGA